jgi:hypothetical protein
MFNIANNNCIFKELSILVHTVRSRLPAFTKPGFFVVITAGPQLSPIQKFTDTHTLVCKLSYNPFNLRS